MSEWKNTTTSEPSANAFSTASSAEDATCKNDSDSFIKFPAANSSTHPPVPTTNTTGFSKIIANEISLNVPHRPPIAITTSAADTTKKFRRIPRPVDNGISTNSFASSFESGNNPTVNPFSFFRTFTGRLHHPTTTTTHKDTTTLRDPTTNPSPQPLSTTEDKCTSSPSLPHTATKVCINAGYRLTIFNGFHTTKKKYA